MENQENPKVIKRFKERYENDKIYEKGDPYTYENEERIAFLMEQGYLQKRKKPPKDDDTELKHTGGGWYELPNGEKIQGKENALAALEESGE